METPDPLTTGEDCRCVLIGARFTLNLIVAGAQRSCARCQALTHRDCRASPRASPELKACPLPGERVSRCRRFHQPERDG